MAVWDTMYRLCYLEVLLIPKEQDLRELILNDINMTQELSNEDLLELIDNKIIEVSRTSYIELEKRLSLRLKLFNSIRGLDVLEEFLYDSDISEIMVNGYQNIFIEKNGMLIKTDKQFSSNEKLLDVIQQIVASSDRRINQASPIADTRLPNGSRVNIVLAPISIDGPAVTIRRFPELPLTMDRLIELNSITRQAADYLRLLVIAGYNIFISGGTGSGKTTFLNVLSAYIPHLERVITIEDSAELKLMHLNNIVRLEARQANTEGANAIPIRELIRTALRMRPRGIIIE